MNVAERTRMPSSAPSEVGITRAAGAPKDDSHHQELHQDFHRLLIQILIWFVDQAFDRLLIDILFIFVDFPFLALAR